MTEDSGDVVTRTIELWRHTELLLFRASAHQVNLRLSCQRTKQPATTSQWEQGCHYLASSMTRGGSGDPRMREWGHAATAGGLVVGPGDLLGEDHRCSPAADQDQDQDHHHHHHHNPPTLLPLLVAWRWPLTLWREELQLWSGRCFR